MHSYNIGIITEESIHITSNGRKLGSREVGRFINPRICAVRRGLAWRFQFPWPRLQRCHTSRRCLNCSSSCCQIAAHGKIPQTLDSPNGQCWFKLAPPPQRPWCQPVYLMSFAFDVPYGSLEPESQWEESALELRRWFKMRRAKDDIWHRKWLLQKFTR